MANTTFEIRGHTLWYNPDYVQFFFVFSAVLEGRIQYYQFTEGKTQEEINEGDAAVMQSKGTVIPYIINARGAGGPKFMTFEGQSVRLGGLMPKGKNTALLHARTRDNKVFAKVELWDEWGVFWFMPMRKGSGGKIEDVRGYVERLGNPQILNGDPWKNPPGP